MKRFIISVILVLAVLPSVADADVDYFESNIVVNSTETEVFIVMIFDAAPRGTLDYPLFYKIEGFKASGIVGAVCEAQRKPWGTNIACDFSNVQGTSRTLQLKFETTELVKIVENQRLFSTTIRAPEDTERLVVRTYLAQGFVLVDPDGVLPPFTPVDGLSGSDGRRIYVVWERQALAKGEGLEVSVAFERVLPQTSETPLFLIMGSIAVIMGIIVLVLMKRRHEESAAAKQPLTLLKDDERKIVEYLQSQGGVTKQRALVSHTGFSKAKVSRLVRDLQTRGVLTVKGMGRVNEVKLTPALSKQQNEAPKTPANESNTPKEPPPEKKDT